MGTPLTGSTVASTYTGLLKTSDNATITSTLKSLGDGGGNDSALQVSSTAVNTTGDFSVATSKFTVAASSGNTAILGTLNVTGATTLSGNLSVPGTLNVTGATSLSSLSTSGAATVGATLGVTGASTLASLGVTGAATIGTTLGVTGATNLSTLGVSGAATLSSTLDVTGNTTLNGNTTIGNAGSDLLTVNANVVTFPNITNQAVDADTDKVIILDSTGRLRSSNANQFAITPATAPQCNQFADKAISVKTATTSGSGADVISVTITPRGYGSMMLVSAVINYSFASGVSKGCVFRLTRNGTEIGTSTYVSGLLGIASASYTDSNTEAINNVKIDFFDSPNTASPVTYKIHLYGSGSMYLNQNFFGSSPQSTTSTITVQEYFA